MTKGTPLVSLSPLEEERFGIRTARASDVRPETLPEVLEFCRENRVVLAICRCSVSEVQAAQALERAGFLLMDTLVYYVRDVREAETEAEKEGRCMVRPFRPGEEKAVRRVAADAFRGYTSHYHADRRLDPRKCNEVYPDWAFRTCVRGAADQVLVAEWEGAVAGFASIRKNGPDEADVLLFGVDPARQGRGIARALLLKTLEWCRFGRISRLLYSTQITNRPAQKLLVRLGFEPAYAFYTFHKWFDA